MSGDGSALRCSFEGCRFVARTPTGARAHARSHTGDKPWHCSELGCSERFPYRSALYAHVRAVHRNASENRNLAKHGIGDSTKDAPRDASALPAENPVHSAAEAGDNGSNVDEGKCDPKVDQDPELVQEAEDISGNCAYFASQLAVARSAKVATWNAADFANAHSWALWISEAVHDFPDASLLSQTLQKRGLYLSSLLLSERAFLESVFYNPLFRPDMLKSLVSSAQSLDALQSANSESLLASAVASDLRRGAELQHLETLRQIVSAPAGDLEEARAALLVRRLGRVAPEHRLQELRRLGESQHTSTRDALLRIASHSGDVANEAINAVVDAGAEFMRDVDATVAVKVCERDLRVFERYLASILRASDESVKKNRRERIRKVEESAFRIGQLRKSGGRVSYLTTAIVKRYLRRRGSVQHHLKILVQIK